MSTPVALFDFDNTLTSQDSILPYLLYCRRSGLCGWGHLLKCAGAYIAQRLDPSRTVRSKAVSLSFLKGKTSDELDALATAFFQEDLQKRLLPEGLAQLESLRRHGTRILIISASPDVYMNTFLRLLPVDEVMCTRTGRDAGGRFDGTVEANCRGQEKVSRLNAWLMEHAAEKPVVIAGYGDSSGDIPMLKQAAAKTLVDPSASVAKALPDARIVHWHRKGG